MQRRSVKVRALLVVVAVVLGACSSGGDGNDNAGGTATGGGGGGVKTSSVDVDEFAAKVCTALKDWLSNIQSRVSDLAAAVAPGPAPDTSQNAFRDYLDAVIIETENFIDSVRAAGIPDVDNGEQATTALIATFERIKSALEDARDEVADLPTDSQQAFAAAAARLAQSIQRNLGNARNALSDVQAPDLENVFASSPACRGAAFGQS